MPIRNIPISEMTTVQPANRTALPDVRMARATESSGVRPSWRAFR